MGYIIGIYVFMTVCTFIALPQRETVSRLDKFFLYAAMSIVSILWPVHIMAKLLSKLLDD